MCISKVKLKLKIEKIFFFLIKDKHLEEPKVFAKYVGTIRMRYYPTTSICFDKKIIY